MPLSEDQKAMLRLLAQREEGYADIAALKGMSVEDVRAEVQDALAELQAVGGVPTARPAAAPSPPAPTPQERPPAPPEPPAPEPGAARARVAVPPERRRLLMLAGGAIGIVAVALIAFVTLGGGSSSNPAGEGQTAGEATGAEGAQLTQATLTPPEGGDASGRAIFGRVGQKEVALQVTATGLEPNRQGESYTVWLYRSPKLALRVGSVKVPASGKLGARFPIPTELLAYVAGGAFKEIYVSRTADAAYEAEVKQAKKQKALPPYTGETALRGSITGPIVKR